MADNRSRIESVRRELRAIAQFDAQKIHESSSSGAVYSQQNSRAGECLRSHVQAFALTCSSARGAPLHVSQQEQ